MNRLELLQKFYEEDPNDPFNLYGLALELIKSDKQKAANLFDEALLRHPSYLPTYYHAAKLYETLSEKELAITIYNRGIQEAKKQNELKALRELQSALDELVFE